MSSPIKNVIIIGASGSIGPAVISSLLSNNFKVSVLTRESSSSTFPPNITVHRTDYSTPSLLAAFRNQDAIVSAIGTMSTALQTNLIDAAVLAGVKRFIPSEYGIDTSIPEVEILVAPTKGKRDTISHLRTKEGEGLSWTAICVGSFFDWAFGIPRIQGWNLPERKALIFDGGKYEYEATNLEQIGRAVAAVLTPEHLEETGNRYVYVNSFTVSQNEVLGVLEKIIGNSFTVSQNEVLGVLEKIIGKKFETEEAEVQELASVGWESLGLKGGWYGHEGITAALYGNGGVNSFSKMKGLWNERLGLPKEDLEESLRRIVEVAGNKKV